MLDNNEVSSHVTFPHLPKLHTLWLNHNKVENLALFISSARCPPKGGPRCPPFYPALAHLPCAEPVVAPCSPPVIYFSFTGLESFSPVEDPQHDEQSSGALLL